MRVSHILGTAACALTIACTTPLASANEAPLLAQAVDPVRSSSAIIDESGVLSPSQEEELNALIRQEQSNNARSIMLAFIPSSGELSIEQWAQQTLELSGGPNTLMIAVDTEFHNFSLYAADQRYWTDAEAAAIEKAMMPHLSQYNWADAAFAAVEAAANPTTGAPGRTVHSSDDGGAGWLIGAGAAVVGVGGGALIWGKRRKKQDSAKAIAKARELDPADTRALASMPLETLAKRAEEVIVETDESVRRGREELNVASAEFSPERTRPFTKAMNQAAQSLRQAYQIKAELNDEFPETPQQQRAMYVEIISTAGQAQQALDEQSQAFEEMRNLLIHADSALDDLTQHAVALSARMEPAQATMAALQADYDPAMLESIDDNIEMARVAMEEADKHIESGRNLVTKPAGQQQGLVSAIKEAERALELAERLLEGIEHAEANIATAKASIAALINEVEEEIAEAQHLRERATHTGTQADWDALEAAVDNAHKVLESARQNHQRDPLGAYTTLTDADTQLDQHLDAVREASSTQERRLRMVQQQLQSNDAQIQAAEDLIASRGRIIDAQARTWLAQAQRMQAQAITKRTSDTTAALDLARQAGNLAAHAINQAQNDIRAYQRRMRANQAASGAGNIVTGMVLGQLLSGGGGGGLGGGFGGGGGGSFGGGGGGPISRGGSF